MKPANGNKHSASNRPTIANMTGRCGHCQQSTVQSIRWCGHARICAECQNCGWHRRLGGRIANLAAVVLQMKRRRA